MGLEYKLERKESQKRSREQRYQATKRSGKAEKQRIKTTCIEESFQDRFLKLISVYVPGDSS